MQPPRGPSGDDTPIVRPDSPEKAADSRRVQRKPESPPEGRRDFKQVADEGDREKKQEASEQTSQTTEGADSSAMSVFDLSRRSAGMGKKTKPLASSEGAMGMSPLAAEGMALTPKTSKSMGTAKPGKAGILPPPWGTASTASAMEPTKAEVPASDATRIHLSIEKTGSEEDEESFETAELGKAISSLFPMPEPQPEIAKPVVESLPRNAFLTDRPDITASGEANVKKEEKLSLGAGAVQPSQAVHPLLSEQAALAAMASAVTASPDASHATAEAAAAHRIQLQQIVDQIVDKVYTLNTSRQTDTTVVLKGTVFEGVKVTVSSYEAARGEINISFTNVINPEARRILDLSANLNALQQILDSKGVKVHMILVSPEKETPITLESQSPSSKQARDADTNSGESRGEKRGSR